MGPHTDKGPFTVIPSDASESLEYLIGDTWLRVAHRPSAFLIHIGDAMAFWVRTPKPLINGFSPQSLTYLCFLDCNLA